MPTILVADDSQSNRQLLEFLLTENGFDCETVENGARAVERALESTFELVLLDINMPVMGGEEALTTLRSLNYDGLVAACSAESNSEEISRIVALGFDGWLQKPVDAGRVSSLLDKLNISNQHPSVSSSTQLSNSDTTEQKIQQLSEQFQNNLPQVLAQLEKAVRQNSISSIKGIGHRLKGVARTFGFAELGSLGGGIEKAIKQGEIEEAMARTELLIDKLKTEINRSISSS